MDKSEHAASIFNKYAAAYEQKFMNTEMYHESFDFFSDLISEKHNSLLEVACGPGNITRYLLNKRPDLKILGTDLAPRMVELARLNNPEAEFKVMDCRNISDLKGKFDAVMCGFCLPYLSKEEVVRLTHDFHQLLNSNGVIYISTMEDDYANSAFKKGSGGDEIFMHFYTSEMVKQILTDNHFEVIRIFRKSYPEPHTGAITTDLIIIAKKISSY